MKKYHCTLFALVTCAVIGAQLDQPQSYRAARISSAALDGSNRDAVKVPSKGTITIADISGAGRIVHMWLTVWTSGEDYLRGTRLRIFWDGETQPSVDVPIGDFHAMGHGIVRQINSAFIAVEARPPELNHHITRKNLASLHSYFPMPYAKGARIEIQNGLEQPISLLFFHVDYQEWTKPPANLRFHAAFRESVPESEPGASIGKREAPNRDHQRDHLILSTTGSGHFVGTVLSVDAMRSGWWEGDDVMFIDGEEQPSIRGTGTEDYFGGAWGVLREFNMPWQGVSYLERIADRKDWQAGRYTMYRFHERDPVPFSKSFRMSIERGHNNAHCDSRYSSVAYWYEAAR